jgi:hypothetical protein
MKLEPVFLVAPKPKPPSMPTRRAFLLAGATFTLGAVTGGACGYSIGAAAAVPPAAEEIPPSGDVELDELRRLAVKAPIEELVERRLTFTNSVFKDYPTDELLWRGVGRLCDAVLAGHAMADRRLFARFLAQMIQQGDQRVTKPLLGRVDQLRRCE